MFKKIPGSRHEKLKVVKITTETAEHVCTEDCFRPRKRPKPKGLKRMAMGFIHYDSDGRCYREWAKGEWMEVSGLTFAIGPGGLHLLFEPKEQLHIHRHGGRTIAKTTKRSDARVGPGYHAREAAKKLKRAGRNLRQAREYLGSEASQVIPKAPKNKRLKGTGRGAPGIPRSEVGRQIVKLIHQGKSSVQILNQIISWAKGEEKEIAGPHLTRIKRQISRWKRFKNPVYK